jgi:hypothetical protein
MADKFDKALELQKQTLIQKVTLRYYSTHLKQIMDLDKLTDVNKRNKLNDSISDYPYEKHLYTCSKTYIQVRQYRYYPNKRHKVEF